MVHARGGLSAEGTWTGHRPLRVGERSRLLATNQVAYQFNGSESSDDQAGCVFKYSGALAGRRALDVWIHQESDISGDTSHSTTEVARFTAGSNP